MIDAAGELERAGRAAASRLTLLRVDSFARLWAPRWAGALLGVLALDSAIPLRASPRPALWATSAAAFILACAREARRRGGATGTTAALAVIDARLATDDLLATAHEEAARRPDHPFTRLLLGRARVKLPDADPALLLPAPRFGRREASTALLFAACAAVSLVPPLGPLAAGGRRDLEAGRAEARRLEETEILLERARLGNGARRVRELRAALEAGRLDRDAALRALDETERAVASESSPSGAADEFAKAGAAMMAGEPAGGGARAGPLNELSRALSKSDAAGAATAARRLAAELREGGAPSETPARLGAAAAAMDPGKGAAGVRSGLARASARSTEGDRAGAAAALEESARALGAAAVEQRSAEAAESATAALAGARERLGGRAAEGAASGRPEGASPAERGAGEAGNAAATGAEGRSGGPAGEAAAAESSGKSGGGAGGGRVSGDPREAGAVSDGGQNDGTDSAPGESGRLGAARSIRASGGQTLLVSGRRRGDESSIESSSARSVQAGEFDSVPYIDALPSYRRAADDAVAHDRVPPAYRGIVRDYFQSLQPRTPGIGPGGSNP